MIYGNFPVGQAAGLLLAHSVSLGDKIFTKGRRLSRKDVAFLRENGISEVCGAQLEANDVEATFAASQVAESLIDAHITIHHSCDGCYDLRAETAGVLVIARDDVDRINLCSSKVAVATLQPWSVVRQGDFIASVRIIPFAVQRQTIEQCCAIADGAHVVTIAPFLPHRVALIMSISPDTPKLLLDETDDVMRGRVESLGSQLTLKLRCNHNVSDLCAALANACAAGCDLILVRGATETMDVHSTVPAAIRAAGGEIEQFGMPVDPGHMLLLARVGNVPVVNFPESACSPSENGLDWVLHRLFAKLPVSARDLKFMGVGGLIRGSSDPASNPTVQNAVF